MNDTARDLAARLIRNFDDDELKPETREPLYQSLSRRLATGTAAKNLGVSIDIVAPGKRACPYHFHHAQEEMFIVLDGAGTLRVAGEMLPVRAGDVMFIPPGPEYPHQIINTSDAPLKYLSISTRDMPEICEYPDSGKYLAFAKHGDGQFFDGLQRTANNLDYWDGEP
ncbi:MAG: cupin domain-containing protein [Betaproteobacteria bacterium]